MASAGDWNPARNDVTLELVLETLNDWWTTEQLPQAQLQSRIVLIFKKGGSGLLSNYRPISLLNAI